MYVFFKLYSTVESLISEDLFIIRNLILRYSKIFSSKQSCLLNNSDAGSSPVLLLKIRRVYNKLRV